MTVTYRRIPSTSPLLGRHIRHDDRSRAYAFDASGLSIVSAKHTRRIPVLDQGNLGSCTGNAGIGCLGTDPFYATVASTLDIRHVEVAPEDVEAFKAKFAADLAARKMMVLPAGAEVTWTAPPHYPLTENGAVQLYSDATKADDYPGQYPPDDTGSDGLTIAKVLKSAGEISGYQHTFNLDDALKVLGITPFITGVNWYSNMFDPDQDGRVYPTGSIAGGHEFVADEIDAANQRVWFTNSWGSGWGLGGRFYLTFADFGDLLSQQGDVTIFTPLTQPAPTPTPTPGDPDAALAAVARPWVARHHTTIAGNSRMQAALKTWLTEKGL